ncbi:hypothetical protein Ahy_A01g001964 [Arachis hypogaea]|uniref:Aminotransferase-like plant mobile domain-containing protein n=1 Tax=Arachis hypogaea TaxID=3818 RepID=A0A445EPZ9_ARAHY|nr:hypothetical protein Ahy_A01g001964 [Arachis hypogaea]
MLLFGAILFGDKSGASVHWKFLPLFHDFGSIRQYSWGSACLAHMYRALCRASHFDCKKINDPLILLLTWVWIRLPYLAPFSREPHSFPLTDRFRQQFGFVQGVFHEERNLDKAHGKVLTGPKNLDWATTTTHSFWVMQWTNRYNHVLTEFPVPPQHPLEIYMYWYCTKYSNHLNLLDLVVQENDENPGQSQSSHQLDLMTDRYSLDARHPYNTSSGTFGGLVSGDSSRSDDGRGILNNQNPRRVSIDIIEENAKAIEQETDDYLVDEPDDEDDEEDEDEDEESHTDDSDHVVAGCSEKSATHQKSLPLQ